MSHPIDYLLMIDFNKAPSRGGLTGDEMFAHYDQMLLCLKKFL